MTNNIIIWYNRMENRSEWFDVDIDPATHAFALAHAA